MSRRVIVISIKPEYVADILNGDKVLEIRKHAPKCKMPIDVYIYCTLGNKKNHHLIEVVDPDTGKQGYEYDYYIGSKGYLDWCLEGKIVAKFTLNTVEEIEREFETDQWGDTYNAFCTKTYKKDFYSKACLCFWDMVEYTGNKDAYAWHIDNLQIFKKPLDFEYFLVCKKIRKGVFQCTTLKRAPQSYCYAVWCGEENE